MVKPLRHPVLAACRAPTSVSAVLMLVPVPSLRILSCPWGFSARRADTPEQHRNVCTRTCALLVVEI